MPRFGFIGEQSFSHLLAFHKPSLFIAITPRAWRAGAGKVNAVIDNITDRWYEGFQERSDVDRALMELYDKVKAVPEDGLVVFGCDFGRSRSRVAASVFARLFSQTTLTSAFCHTNPGEEEQVSLGHDFELEESLSVDALVNRYWSIIPRVE